MNRKILAVAFLIAMIGFLVSFISDVIMVGVLDKAIPTDSHIYRFIAVVLILFLMLAVFIGIATYIAGTIVGVDVDTVDASSENAKPYLLMGFSPNKNGLEKLLTELDNLKPENVASNTEIYKSFYSDPCDSLQNPWQQNLRSMWFHLENLEKVYVLENNEDSFDAFKEYLKKAVEIHNSEMGTHYDIKIIRICSKQDPVTAFKISDSSGRAKQPDYEDYDYVYKGLMRGLDMIREDNTSLDKYHKPDNSFPDLLFGSQRSRIADKMTCIDITAGQKVFSIAGAVLTLNRPLKFSYVTNQGELRFFDTNVRIANMM